MLDRMAGAGYLASDYNSGLKNNSLQVIVELKEQSRQDFFQRWKRLGRK